MPLAAPLALQARKCRVGGVSSPPADKDAPGVPPRHVAARVRGTRNAGARPRRARDGVGVGQRHAQAGAVRGNAERPTGTSPRPHGRLQGCSYCGRGPQVDHVWVIRGEQEGRTETAVVRVVRVGLGVRVRAAGGAGHASVGAVGWSCRAGRPDPWRGARGPYGRSGRALVLRQGGAGQARADGAGPRESCGQHRGRVGAAALRRCQNSGI